MNWRSLPLLPLVTLFACADPANIAEPDENGRVIGTIEYYAHSVQLDVPATVVRGTDLNVTVVTYGGGCAFKGDTEVDRDGLRAVVTPYDQDSSRPDTFCNLILKSFTHEAVLRFDNPGIATVTVRGQRKPSREIFSVRRTVIVQ